MNKSILIVEDDARLRDALCQITAKEGYRPAAVESGEKALEKASEHVFALVISDLKLPGISGMQVLQSLRSAAPDTSVIIITAYASVDTAVEAMKNGAEDYIVKPFSLDEIRIIINRVMEKRGIVIDNALLREQLKEKYSFDNIIGNSEPMIEVYKMINKVKDTKATVLVTGETGTGKELIARALHYNGTRRERPFIPVNCCALTDSLLESQLFGFAKGAFTGALKDTPGLFELAEGGTIFLDEIGDTGANFQQMLLRVMEGGEIQPVGSAERKKVDVRVVAATNKDLETAVQEGKFREDLYYRLNVITIRIPPLRDRKDDILTLARHFMNKYSKENNKAVNEISPESKSILESYLWPGNVRELENTISKAVIFESGNILTPDTFPERMRLPSNASAMSGEDLMTLEEVSRTYIVKVLEMTGGNKARASEILGINRTSLWRMIQRLGITE
ncbi:MAG TPA: sigma-54 dependent transcriptional regulator [Spirochaetota bacterium]|nr:sigma-54 dependent transcriptional regulator [Spirochaetota bacterium]HPG51281.1 sigma-54 dependent transcriptional regulator [Spirochaetota bacterium]HPN13365.1 sigma-54 dependent transcriptional regulator [Spirochaetota bacterium]